MLQNLLKSFNLNEKEVTVFMNLLNLGPQPASSLARICEMPRNTVRGILENLAKNGLVVRSKKGNSHYYATEEKDGLQQTLKRKKEASDEKLNQQMQLLEEYGDELSTKRRSKSKPRITFYEGISGLEKVYEDTLTASSGLRSWGSFDVNVNMLPDYFNTYYSRRAKKKIPMKSIHPDTPLARAHQDRNAKELRESALVPKERFAIGPEIQVYDNKVNIVSWEEKIGIIIESHEIADALVNIFELSYEAAISYGQFTVLQED